MTERGVEAAEMALAVELMRFIEEAVAQILREEDEGAFLEWVRAEAPRRLPGLFADLPNEQAARSITFEMGREIWNMIPLPGAGYRTRPIPRPERNAPCPCGSGQKHKRCCGAIAGGRLDLPFEAEDAWTLVLSQSPDAEVEQLVIERRVPRGLIPGIAERLIDFGDAETALSLLEPLFAEPDRLDERDAPALDALIEAYDSLDLHESKERAIARLDSALRPPLRLVLWEALARSFVAQGDSGRAWDAVERIRRADPDSPVLGSVEVILLLGENRLAEASERAKDALSRHRRRPGLSEESLALLQETADDPAASRRRLLLDDLLPNVERFERLLATLSERPIRPYTVNTEGERPGTGRLLPPEGLSQIEDAWAEVAFGSLDLEGPDEGEEPDFADEDEETDEEDWEDEEAWDEEEEESEEEEDEVGEEATGPVWDLDAGLDDEEDEEDWSDDPEETWGSEDTGRWLAFLEENPQAFDSFLVLADLVDRASVLAQSRDTGLSETIVRPLLARSVAILDASLAAAPQVTFPIDLEGNLQALELLQISALLSGKPSPSVEPLERLLRLDPEDSLEVRGDLAMAYLWTQEPEKVLDLAARFAHDEGLYLPYAKVLALRQLQRKEESLAALDEALDRQPLVGVSILRASSRVPDALLDLWESDEELSEELRKRVEDEAEG